ncbi:unnamed protein product [Kuraishia capsulata CBS 1993]|uniref:Myb-like domain-containing protein n=1 Tax=Kuraishia capsulata CBS 1993 TaxID=1382522 RepID=W6MXL1_9ASCO|nr:uncharacterized protein KUCA_T00005067001 [Kuraishia capsulata CBS 1993]CDK29080.1 unnamed protein product [Kuraishia capsulata CBS 1993]
MTSNHRPLTSENLQKNNNSLTTADGSAQTTIYSAESGSTIVAPSTPENFNSKSTVRYARLNWSSEEDLLLLQNVISNREKLNENGSRTGKFWELIASEFSMSRSLSRSDRQCKDRFYVLFRRPYYTHKGKHLRPIDVQIEQHLAEARNLFAVDDGIKILTKGASLSGQSSETSVMGMGEPLVPPNSASYSGEGSDSSNAKRSADFEMPLEPLPTRRKLNSSLDMSDDSSFEDRHLDADSALRRGPPRRLSPLSEFARSVRDASDQLQREFNRKDIDSKQAISLIGPIAESLSSIGADVEDMKEQASDVNARIDAVKQTMLDSLEDLRRELEERDQRIFEELKAIKQKMALYAGSGSALPPPSRSSSVSLSIQKMDSNFGNFPILPGAAEGFQQQQQQQHLYGQLQPNAFSSSSRNIGPSGTMGPLDGDGGNNAG